MRRQLWMVVPYALAATLVMAAPLAASDQPAQAVIEEAVPPAAPQAPSGEAPSGEALSTETPPADAQPAEAPPQDAAAERRQKREPVVAKAAPGTVTISDFEFSPASVTVDVGDTVTWSNAGPAPHSATGDGFDTDIFEEGESRSHTFTEAGSFDYICTPHPGMKGTVVVRAAAAQGGDDGGSTDAGAGAGAGGDASTASDTGAPEDSATVPTLPATGLDAGGVLALGLMTLALGALIHRRSSGTG